MSDPGQFQLSGNAAEQYEQIPARYLLGPWAPGLVEAARIQPEDHVLDVACGTGLITRLAAAKLGAKGQLTGLDLNEGMLDVARSLSVRGDGHLTWLLGSAQDMELGDGSFDVALCQQGLQFFPEPDKALLETYRVLRQGGRACYSVWAGHGVYNDAIHAAVSAHIGAATAEQYIRPRATPGADTLRELFANAGFRDVAVSKEEMAVRFPDVEKFIIANLRGTPIAAAIKALSDSEQAALAKDAAKDLTSYADGVDVVVPDAINLVQARK